MSRFLNDLVEWLNDFLEKRPGFLPLLGAFLILINLLLQFVPGPGIWLTDSNLLLHLGLILGIVGLLLVSVYRH